MEYTIVLIGGVFMLAQALILFIATRQTREANRLSERQESLSDAHKSVLKVLECNSKEASAVQESLKHHGDSIGNILVSNGSRDGSIEFIRKTLVLVIGRIDRLEDPDGAGGSQPSGGQF